MSFLRRKEVSAKDPQMKVLNELFAGKIDMVVLKGFFIKDELSNILSHLDSEMTFIPLRKFADHPNPPGLYGPSITSSYNAFDWYMEESKKVDGPLKRFS